jgi:hypothetical protein
MGDFKKLSRTANKWDDFSGKESLGTLKRLNTLVKLCYLKKEPFKEGVQVACAAFNSHVPVWGRQQILQGKPSTMTRFKSAMWYLLYPYLTTKGLKRYNQLVGNPLTGYL